MNTDLHGYGKAIDANVGNLPRSPSRRSASA